MPSPAPRLLVVDDEPAVRRFLQHCLEAEGFGVVCCGGAAEALDLLQRGTFAAVLLDNGLPVLMGIAALPAILESARAPVILITGFKDDDMVQDALLLGASAVLHKPFEPKALVAKLRRLLAMKR